MHVDSVIILILIHMHAYMTLFPADLDHIPVLCPLVGLGCTAKINCLEYIRLSLGIIPVKNVDTRIELNGSTVIIPESTVIIPEIQQVQRFNVQFLFHSPRTLQHRPDTISFLGGYQLLR